MQYDAIQATGKAKPQVEADFWCRIHLWFRLMGSLQAKSMTSQRYRAVTRWRICVTMATLWQDGGYALLFNIFNSTVIDWTCFFIVKSLTYIFRRRNAVAQLVEALCYKPEGHGFDSRWCQRNFSLTYAFRSHYGPGADSASNIWVPGIFPGVKGGRTGLTTLPPSCADCL